MSTKKTLALRVTPTTFEAYEKAAKMMGTTNSNLLGIMLKHFVDTKLVTDYQSRIESQLNDIRDSVGEINEEELALGRMGRPSTKQEETAGTRTASSRRKTAA